MIKIIISNDKNNTYNNKIRSNGYNNGNDDNKNTIIIINSNTGKHNLKNIDVMQNWKWQKGNKHMYLKPKKNKMLKSHEYSNYRELLSQE